MKKQLIGFTLLFFSCVLTPLVAEVDLDVHMDILDDLERFPRPGESMTITVDVQEDGSPVEGETVTFSVSPDDGSASLSTTSATTDSNGEAQTTLTFGSDSSGKYYSVTVTLDDGKSSNSQFPVTTVSDGAVFKLYINHLRPYSPGESVAFTASLRKDGKGVPDKTVTFSVSPDDGTASLSTTSGTTDSNGDVGTTLVLGSNASGSYSVTATLDDGTSKSNSTGTVHNPNKPSGFIFSMTVSSGALPLNPGKSRTFTAIVQKDGSYISDRTVTFSVSPDDGTVSLNPTSATTGSDGRASTSLITGSDSSGTYTVTATLDNGQSISGTSTVEASSSPLTNPNPDSPVETNPPPEIGQIPQEQRAASTGSTNNTPTQQAAPETSTDNTPAQQAAPETSTGNTQRTPRSVTTNTPADTTGTPTPDTPEQQASDLVVDALEVNKDVLDAGESFTISAVVRNQSEGSSSTGTLTYYQYFDDKSVEKVGESDIASLAAGETTDVSITLTAPETSGTYSYYACVSTNCTSIVKISVGSEIKEVG